jgi:hypothetical protein
MSHDPTESYRRARVAELNAPDAPAPEGQTWDTEALQRDYEVLGFMAPFIVVRRRADGVKGSLEFTHSPRMYFNWSPYR